MTQKAMVIIGAGPGISLSTAKKFGQNGFAIALVSRSLDSLNQYVEELQSEGIEARAFQANAASNESLRNAIGQAAEGYGRLDALLYNVYHYTTGAPTSIEPIELAHALQVNVTGALTSVQAALPHMTEGGTILLTGGGLALSPLKNFSSVSIGKAALRNLALTLHQELRSQKIYAGTLTVKGFVKKETDVSPENIAKIFYEMHEKRDASEYIIEKK